MNIDISQLLDGAEECIYKCAQPDIPVDICMLGIARQSSVCSMVIAAYEAGKLEVKAEAQEAGE